MTTNIRPNWPAIRRQLVHETLQRAAIHGRDTLTREEQKRIDRAMTDSSSRISLTASCPMNLSCRVPKTIVLARPHNTPATYQDLSKVICAIGLASNLDAAAEVSTVSSDYSICQERCKPRF